MNLLENIKLALRNIRSNTLRTVLTFSIIAIGITALVGILTAIDSIENAISTRFSEMGANTFNVRDLGFTARQRTGVKQNQPRISYREAVQFKREFDLPADVALSTRASFSATIKHLSVTTHPNVTVFGVDENYLHVTGMSIDKGRNFSTHEMNAASNVAIIGQDIMKTLFSNADSALQNMLSIGNIKYSVIGVLQSRGTSFVSSDNIVLIPILNANRYYSGNRKSFVISVMVDNPEVLETTVEEATGLMRIIRRDDLRNPDSFQISKSDRLATTLLDQIKFIALAATIIGMVTLLGAGVGLMNIMLVSVNERTREIGLSKAIGAKAGEIRTQFLVEAVVICQIGGLLGIVLGIFAGNLVSLLLQGSFIIPWVWMITGITFCFIIGILAGLYPAIKAARLDPIEALRYE